LQGLAKSELEKLSPNFPYDVPSHIENGGESPEMIFERMNNFVNKLKQMSKHSSHIIVSHGDPISIYLSGTLLKVVPHTDAEFYHSKIRYIPMGGLVMLDYSQSGVPKYTEII
jgi:broad specificity phosphatase PhoE